MTCTKWRWDGERTKRQIHVHYYGLIRIHANCIFPCKIRYIHNSKWFSSYQPSFQQLWMNRIKKKKTNDNGTLFSPIFVIIAIIIIIIGHIECERSPNSWRGRCTIERTVINFWKRFDFRLCLKFSLAVEICRYAQSVRFGTHCSLTLAVFGAHDKKAEKCKCYTKHVMSIRVHWHW